MGASFALTLNTKATEVALRRLKDRAPSCIARAMNRAVKSATTLMIRTISQDTGVKQKDLRGTTKRNRAIWSSEAAPGRQSARVYASTERIPLIDFNARGPRPSRGKGRGVTAGLRGGAKRYPHAFIAAFGSGHVAVMTRLKGVPTYRGEKRESWWKGRPELPIDELHGPSIYHVWMRYQQLGADRAREQLLKNLRHEFRFAMGQVATPPSEKE
jgi:hypothetical protein